MVHDESTPQPPDRAETAPPPKPPSGPTPTAYRLAALVLGLGVAMSLAFFLFGGQPDPITIVIDAILIAGLLFYKPWARSFTLIRVGLGAVLWPILYFLGNPPLIALVSSLIQWGFCGALLLLLTGETKPRRLAIALAIYAALVLVPSAALFMTFLLRAR